MGFPTNSKISARAADPTHQIRFGRLTGVHFLPFPIEHYGTVHVPFALTSVFKTDTGDFATGWDS